jgi:hypothetical protein
MSDEAAQALKDLISEVRRIAKDYMMSVPAYEALNEACDNAEGIPL